MVKGLVGSTSRPHPSSRSSIDVVAKWDEAVGGKRQVVELIHPVLASALNARLLAHCNAKSLSIPRNAYGVRLTILHNDCDDDEISRRLLVDRDMVVRR